MKDAKLHEDAMELCGVLLDELGALDALRERLIQNTLNLLEQVTRAVSVKPRLDLLEDADATLQVVRTQLFLAEQVSIVDEEVYEDLSDRADLLGRQIGGWLKKLRQDGA